MENRNWNNVSIAREQIAGYQTECDNIIIAVNFRLGIVEDVIPVWKNRKGECTNFDGILADLEQSDCHPRRVVKQSVPHGFDQECILIFDRRIA